MKYRLSFAAMFVDLVQNDVILKKVFSGNRNNVNFWKNYVDSYHYNTAASCGFTIILGSSQKRCVHSPIVSTTKQL